MLFALGLRIDLMQSYKKNVHEPKKISKIILAVHLKLWMAKKIKPTRFT